MKKEYFRIVQTSQGDQVLISKDYDAEEEKPTIKITVGATDTEGLIIQGTVNMGFKDEENRDEKFITFSTNDADNFFKIIEDSINGILEHST